MSTPSTALDGIAARPAPAPALKIVPARHPLQVFGTVLALALILIGLQSVLGNPRWGWGTFAEWFFARPVLEGLGRTLLLTALGTGLGFALGTLLALARVSGSPLLSAVSWGYVWLFRSIPLLVLLLLLNNLGYLYSTIELGVPFTGISLFSYPTTQLIGVFTAAVLGLTLNQAAFSAEVIRGGILSVDHGQYEAAAALGLPRGRQVRRIILPQAMRSILPAAFNDVIGLAKSTSVVYVLALPELFYTVQVIYRRNLEVVPLLMVATVWYLVILTVLSLLQRRVEQRFARGQLQRERSVSRVSSPPRVQSEAAPRVASRPRIATQVEAGEGAAVSLHGVGKVFGDQPVLEDVNLDLRAGSVTVLIGPSGAGKSTLLRLINHLERADGGYVTVGGQLIGYRREGDTLYELPEREIRRRRAEVGMVFQGFNLFPHLTALENIIEAPMAVRGVPRAQAEQQARTLLERVGLADKADAFPRQLSGGQQQRIAIARALALQPKVLLFDEPTSALDPELVAEVLSVIEELARSGTTLVIVTHELSFARRVADHVVMMDQGRVIEQGTPEALFERPRQQRTADFLAKTL
ncbi:TPA: amino acid ABC transporter permease/ATP-binding protein [Stenotrophomonas maltophilia]|uniref:amino acid ABC transporter permease/ATP-binding protein n=1 Tax=Stenotrophomonas TaxID=40323 RepID=UPI001AA114CE|nr:MULTISPECIES: amino acid ABC transporter permease/ATP-binding protein [Stenotrophomonas]ELF4107366.1 amino acid ABC transporter permease/ATP-binding protein [Stenotrophomonas maltophilia]MBO1744416.1 amino acid ABC transporter permease/ATP-binding protein [Stenotrophomonas maltophilia]MCU1176081.1 amino acid ABC transporter permease/ATP-binding protein [Stenotrophomonas maltophilia]HEA4093574.1 amino acid ABC transporter permease/ATP-binding protein [Stenotrophomonas maltophilia]HEA4098394.